MPRVLPPAVRRTLVVFAACAGLLLSMAQACAPTCGTSASGSSPRTTDRTTDDSSAGKYFRDRAQGMDGTGSTRTTRTRDPNGATCIPGGRPTTTRTHSDGTDGKSGNNGSAFDKGYDEGYDDGYDDGHDDARRRDTGRSGNDRSAFDEGYAKGYGEGYGDGHDDARRKETGDDRG